MRRNAKGRLFSVFIDRSDFPTLPSIMRISPKPADTCPWYLWPFFWNQRRKYGAVLESALLWARAPKVFLGVAFLYGMIDLIYSPVNLGLRSLITVRVSLLYSCLF